ncbi:glutathione reductase-like protein [Aaosphaeria arxii CBS 175.79]|uniref:Glutathione reductase n=1 Tax=Aaosphaeria arxii CBS 175.79 TaxID=1450172 RepID=A0A6A5XLN8_9PLEO|nr:glutathione reductase-like protein [Aaosphaeria arxii CBS 175.79]KAF2013769.1 glutathione reductase-like protein [Aaosphaeria arxii CBS 175.79]
MSRRLLLYRLPQGLTSGLTLSPLPSTSAASVHARPLLSTSKSSKAILAAKRLSAFSRHFSSANPTMAPVPKEADYLVIGIGSGGIASARRAAKHGAKVIAIESKRMGGTCVNVGCVPKKVTWNAAAIAETFRDAKSYGFGGFEQPSFDWPYFKQKRDAYVKRLNGIYENNLNRDEIEHIKGRAKFISKNEVEVALEAGGTQRVKAKHILIATGGRPHLPDIPGKELCIDSDGFFDLEQLPKRIVTSGAGYIGVEMSGMLHALGSTVDFVIRGNTLLRSFDPMIQDTVTKEYERQGVNLHKGSQITKVEDIGNGQKKVTIKNSSTGEETVVEADTVLFAVGRTPEIEDLHIKELGINLNGKNHIVTDKYQNTNLENVYAIGDVCDRGFELTPVAIAAGRRLSDRIFGGQKDRHLEYDNIPSVVFAHPEIGSIGLTEPQAREKYGDKVKVYKTQFTGMYYAMMDPEEKGPTAYKIVVVGEEEKVVGLHILGQGSSEILQGFGVAIKMGATKKDFDSCVAIHPVSAEELVTMT